jgi:outer membrane lipoprotein SlyB
MSNAIPLKATQIVGAVAVVGALLGGAYAVGRSQSAEAPATPVTETKPTVAAVRHAAAPSATQQCESCGVVADVHTETRQAKTSGLGAVGGAVIGGLLGSAIGKGDGRKVATVGGAVAGGFAGNEVEKRERAHQVWVVQVRQSNGQMRRFERSADPGVRVGDQVSLHGDGFALI